MVLIFYPLAIGQALRSVRYTVINWGNVIEVVEFAPWYVLLHYILSKVLTENGHLLGRHSWVFLLANTTEMLTFSMITQGIITATVRICDFRVITTTHDYA